MTEKYEIENIGNMFRVLKDGEPLTTKFENWDRMDVINLVKELNELHEKNQDNETMIEFLSTENSQIRDELKTRTQIQHQLEEENKQLQSELSRYKEVNRLDIWKSSYSSEDALITELQDKCDKKQEHIVILENKIHRMREAIHKLEWLATHRNGELIKENEKLKQDKQHSHQAMSREEIRHKQFKNKVFDLIDEKIKELKNINNVSIIPRESIEVLEDLKRELLE